MDHPAVGEFAGGLIAMPHRPRHRAAAALLLACLAGCSWPPPDGRYLPNHTDWARAQVVWTDPWLAPAETTTPGAGGTQQVGAIRIAGRDSALLSGSLETIRSTEIAAARRAGWRLIGVDCNSSWESFELVFERGEDVNDQARVRLSYRKERPREGASSAQEIWTRFLTAEVPHHVETTWPKEPTITHITTCSPIPELPQGRLAKADQAVPVPTWHSSTTEEAAQALADQANGGTFLASLKLKVVPTGPNRLAVPAEHEPPRVMATPVPPRAPRDLIKYAKRDGYVLTYAACGLGRSITELRRVLKDGTVTVRFVAEPDTGYGSYFDAQVVTGSTEFGPPAKLDEVAHPCPDGDASAEGFVWAGRPWFGPTEFQRRVS
ncbi:MAG: hypothetical protein Q3997_07950 [Propionibacteriaceae bacterium]|nr:hypothetical protein [Propionibacteriaceae bacterium]